MVFATLSVSYDLFHLIFSFCIYNNGSWRFTFTFLLAQEKTLNTVLTLIVLSSSNSNTLALTALVTQNGPTKRGLSFPGEDLNERHQVLSTIKLPTSILKALLV